MSDDYREMTADETRAFDLGCGPEDYPADFDPVLQARRLCKPSHPIQTMGDEEALSEARRMLREMDGDSPGRTVLAGAFARAGISTDG